jgi:hypothetical protein
VSLLDKAVRKLAARWLKRKVDAARQGGSSMLKLLDGNKRLIMVLGFIAAGLVALATGRDVTQWIDLGLRAFGWQDVALIELAKGIATKAVPLLWSIWASSHALLRMWRQHKAGATFTEINSPAGYVKQAVADGTIKKLVPLRRYDAA